MSVGAILAIVFGGVALLAAGVITLIVLVLRKTRANVPMSASAARAAVEARGWTFAERDDSYVPIYDRLHERIVADEPLRRLRRPPRAKAAKNVVTGTYRGRSFVAATFETVYDGKHQPVRAIWVATPSPHPYLTLQRIIGPQDAINRTIGVGGVQLGDPEFDRSFELLSHDERFAHAVFGPELKAFLQNDPRTFRGFTLNGEYLDVADPVDDHRNPDELVPALELRCDLLDRISAWSTGPTA